MQILVVGGETHSRACLVRMLESADVFCMETSRMEEVGNLLATCHFDRVIFDPRGFEGDADTLAAAVAERGLPLALVEGDDALAGRLGAAQRLELPWPRLDVLLEKLGHGVAETERRAPAASARHDGAASPDASGDTPEVHRMRERCKELERTLVEQRETIEQAQESFNQELSRMMNIISNIMDGIVFTDADACITLMNPVAEELLGVRAFMTVGQSLWDLEPDGGDLIRAILDDCNQASDWRESSRVVEVHHDAKDLLYIRMRISRVLNYRGEYAGMLIQLQDVTAEHKSDQLKNQYLSIVAHELRTPLTGIKTFSTMMSKGTLGPLTDQQVRVVESIREQSLRLEHQIDKLINLGHIESNEYGQDLEYFDVADLLGQALVPFEQPAKERDIDLEVRLPSGERMIEGDRAELRRAIQALVENAIKFTADGGQVTVELADAGEDRIAISVRDTGVGIDPRYHRRIFEKFFQVEDPLTRHHGGSGLGLFFVRGIVEAHGSTVQVDSQLGQGAKFSFVLSRRVDRQQERPRTSARGMVAEQHA